MSVVGDAPSKTRRPSMRRRSAGTSSTFSAISRCDEDQGGALMRGARTIRNRDDNGQTGGDLVDHAKEWGCADERLLFAGSNRTKTPLDVGVLLVSATLSKGTSTLVSG